MIWALILLLAGLAFALAAFALRLPKAGWSLFGAALLFGLAGYALQGSPELPAAPAAKRSYAPQAGTMLVEARRNFYGAERLPSRHVLTSDAFARQGRWNDAASFLTNAVGENPGDGEAWLALGNALVEVAEGRMTPAAETAYNRAALTSGDNVAPAFFYGLAMLRGGDPAATRALWAEVLAKSPEEAPGREMLADRLTKLDALIARIEASDSPQASGK